MTRAILMSILLYGPVAAIAADDPRISRLEQTVRELRRQIEDQQRSIEELRAQLTRPAPSVVVPSPPTTSPATGDWLDASRWRRISTGMNELEVIGVLGVPTSTRMENGDRILLYALEIGRSGFLGGSVSFRDGAVVAIRAPTLR